MGREQRLAVGAFAALHGLQVVGDDFTQRAGGLGNST